MLDCCPCFWFCFLVFVGPPRFLDAWAWVSSLRCIAGLGEIPPDVSCGNDVEDELVLELEEPVDPGTTISTKFSLLHRIILPFLVSCGFWPTLGQEACLRRFAPPRRAQSRERILWLPHVFARLHWLWSPLWGFWMPEQSPVRLNSDLSCSACALMLPHLPQMFFPRVSSKKVL